MSTDSIYAKTRRPFSTGARAKLEETDQQYRGDAYYLPSSCEKVERSGSECE